VIKYITCKKRERDFLVLTVFVNFLKALAPMAFELLAVANVSAFGLL